MPTPMPREAWQVAETREVGRESGAERRSSAGRCTGLPPAAGLGKCRPRVATWFAFSRKAGEFGYAKSDFSITGHAFKNFKKCHHVGLGLAPVQPLQERAWQSSGINGLMTDYESESPCEGPALRHASAARGHLHSLRTERILESTLWSVIRDPGDLGLLVALAFPWARMVSITPT